MPMNDYASQPQYNNLQPWGQRARQTDMNTGMMNTMNNYQTKMSGQALQYNLVQTGMNTGMMNTMNNYQSGMSGQVLQNNPAHSSNPPPAHYQAYTNHDNSGFWNDPQHQAVQSYGDHMPIDHQGDMPTPSGDQMNTPQDQTLLGTLNDIVPLWQLFDFLPGSAEPFKSIYSGPLFSQEARSRQPLQFGSDPTLAFRVHNSQMETLQASNLLNRHPAGNQKANTRKKNFSQSANRVNKSIRRRKPAKAQKLQSAIAESASQLLDKSTAQAMEAQNDPDADGDYE
ncbi:hypothetical protein EAE96_010635 [Botrytis aclada]|nr:hypothetical protein EAE96_010635 [Botrytis aclada]